MRSKDMYKPYIRRMNGKEKAGDMRTAFRLAFYQDMPKAYVMVQKGFPNDAIAVGMNKDQVKNSILTVGCGHLKFKEWANIIKKRAQGNEDIS